MFILESLIWYQVKQAENAYSMEGSNYYKNKDNLTTYVVLLIVEEIVLISQTRDKQIFNLSALMSRRIKVDKRRVNGFEAF